MAARIPSEFVPLDVNYSHDRAIRAAGPMAELLFLRALTYARRTKSHGFLPDFDLPVFGVGLTSLPRQAKALVRERLWVEVDGGWRIRSWAKWNPTSTAESQAAQSLGGTLGNHNRWHSDGRHSEGCAFCDPSGERSGSDRGTDRSAISVPDRVGIAEVEVEREKRERQAS